MSYDNGDLIEELHKIEAEIIKQINIANGDIRKCNLNNLFKLTDELDHITWKAVLPSETKQSLLNLSKQLSTRSMSIELLQDLMQTVGNFIKALEK